MNSPSTSLNFYITKFAMHLIINHLRIHIHLSKNQSLSAWPIRLVQQGKHSSICVFHLELTFLDFIHDMSAN